MQFLVEIAFDAPAVPADDRDALLAREREVAFQLKRDGVIERMWRVADRPATVSIWRAEDSDELEAQLGRLPLRPFLTLTTTVLTTHYLEE